MDLQGTIVQIGELETIGLKGFQKQLVVIKTNEQYPQTIPVEFTQDKCSLLKYFKNGDIVSIGINIRGSEWKGKHYANINGWKISKDTTTGLTAEEQMPGREDINDLPF